MREPVAPEEITATQAEPEEEPTADLLVDAGSDAGGQPKDMNLPIQSETLEPVPDLPAAPTFPSLEEYKIKWAEKLALHSRENHPLVFTHQNLVPKPVTQLWQDCPHVPFEELKSDESQWRLSVSRPLGAFSGLQYSPKECGGVPMYKHISGEVDFRRYSQFQLTSMLGFVLHRNDGAFLRKAKLQEEEIAAIHESPP